MSRVEEIRLKSDCIVDKQKLVDPELLIYSDDKIRYKAFRLKVVTALLLKVISLISASVTVFATLVETLV